MNNLKKDYIDKYKGELQKELDLTNVMDVPVLKKITVNSGIGEFRENREAVESFVEELSLITGQKPSPRKARVSESGFKVRKGEVVGYTVTLRGEKMWAFLEKLIAIALPRVRDFKGLNLNSFDKNGNYSMGIREHIIFPEVNPNKVKGIRGLQMTMSIKANNNEHSLALLKKFGIPFKKD